MEQVLGQPAPAPPEDVLGRLALLASAIAGRRVELRAGGPGEPTFTDGSTIFVDPSSSHGDLVGAIAVQGALLSAGSLDPDLAPHLGRRTVAARYLTLEGHRALAGHEGVVPPAVRTLVDRALSGRSASPAESLALARSDEPVAEPPAVFGTIRPQRLRADVERPGARTGDPAHHRLDRTAVLQDLDEDDADDQASFDLFSSPVGGGGPIGRLLKRLFGDARSDRGGAPAAEGATHSTRRAARGSAVSGVAARVAPAPDPAGDHPRGFVYPEWDVHRRRYRPAWCTVLEEVAVPANTALVVPDVHQLRRPLARLGVELDRRHRQLQGDDIDIDAVVERLVEVAAGAPPDEAVYVDSLRCRRDLSVLLLLDISGSTGERDELGRTVHDQQRFAAAMLGTALHDLGDRVALHGFRSQGRSAVQIVVAKQFDDGFDARVLRRLQAMTPGAYTRLGAAVRHGASVLESQGGTARRLLVVVSDGLAYDHGYEGRYAEADVRRALAEARRRGTGCLCLSVGAATDPSALRQVFGTAAHAGIPRLDRLAGVVGPLFGAALVSADAQRRVWQRRTRTRERLSIERALL